MRQKTDWRTKLHPAFFELAEVNLQYERKWRQIQQEWKQGLAALGTRAPAGLRAEAVRRLQEKINNLEEEIDQKLVDIDRRHRPLPYNPLAYSYLELSPGQPDLDVDNLAAYIHWSRHGESLRVATAKDNQGDIAAWRRLARTGEDLRRVVHKKGPIKPFQGDVVHQQLLELILCFELRHLTVEELAECVDHYCPCGKEHDASAVRKQLARLRERLKACASNSKSHSGASGQSAPPLPKQARYTPRSRG